MSPGEDMEAKRCAACKFLRRKCSPDCVLAPHFPASDPHRYACVQRVFGAGNAARMLQQLPVQERAKAADAMAVEAYRRVQDPVYGCAGVINRLQEEIHAAQCELAWTRAQIAMHGAADDHARTTTTTLPQWHYDSGDVVAGAPSQHVTAGAWLDDFASDLSFP